MSLNIYIYIILFVYEYKCAMIISKILPHGSPIYISLMTEYVYKIVTKITGKKILLIFPN